MLEKLLSHEQVEIGVDIALSPRDNLARYNLAMYSLQRDFAALYAVLLKIGFPHPYRPYLNEWPYNKIIEKSKKEHPTVHKILGSLGII